MTVVEFQLHHKSIMNISLVLRTCFLNDGFVQTPSVDLCAATTIPVDKMVVLQELVVDSVRSGHFDMRSKHTFTSGKSAE